MRQRYTIMAVGGNLSADAPRGSASVVTNLRLLGRGIPLAEQKTLILAQRIVAELDGPPANALAIEGERVVAVADKSAFDTWVDPGTRVINLGPVTVLPGFVETHAHLIAMGAAEARLSIGSPPHYSVGDILETIRQQTLSTPPGQWIVGYRYDDTRLREQRPPNLEELTKAAPHHPVYLTHNSGHLAVANRLAFQLAGIGDESELPGLVKDASGTLTGLIRQSAARAPIEALLPRPTFEEQVDFVGRAVRQCWAKGVTAACDSALGGIDAWNVYRTAEDRRTLGVRTQCFPRIGTQAEVPHAWHSAFLSIGPVKLFADGSIQGHTGLLRAPYYDEPDHTGIAYQSVEGLTELLASVLRDGWKTAIHANGDQAIDNVLDAFESLAPQFSVAGSRIEHAQMARPEQLDRMKKLAVLPSFFIGHVYYFGDGHRTRFLGPERAQEISPLAWALSRGIPFSLHSDSPVVTPIDPLLSIAAASGRRTRDGFVLGPDLRIPVTDAFHAYTDWAAVLRGQEHDLGSLRPGRYADFITFAENPLIAEPDRIREIPVQRTFVGGQEVWARNG